MTLIILIDLQISSSPPICQFNPTIRTILLLFFFIKLFYGSHCLASLIILLFHRSW